MHTPVTDLHSNADTLRSEALGADIHSLGLERGHRTLTVCRKGGKIVTTIARTAFARRSGGA